MKNLTEEQQQGLNQLIEANGLAVAIDKNVGFALVGKKLAVATDKKGSSFELAMPGFLGLLSTVANSCYSKTRFTPFR